MIVASSQPGFSLIEFVVIISIFAIMAGVGLFNFRGFQTDVSLTNLAHDIALTIKRAQSEGTSSVSSSDPLNPIVHRGVAFPYTGGAFTQEFKIFDDIDQNGSIDEPQELVDIIRIQSEDFIHGIATGGVPTALTTPVGDTFYIMFQRPFPDVFMMGDDPNNPTSDQYAAIVVSNQDQSRKKMVLISRVGEISVRPCDPASTSLCDIP